jgi:glutathione peroxidase
MGIYDITVNDQDGNDVSLGDYRGKTLLIVNTATGCGFTPQYDGLQDLYDRFNKDGLEILDFPCNQFGNQAPGSDEEIHDFCTGRYGITFPQFQKIDVNGANESPLYAFLKKEKGGLFGSNIKWNFTKFIVDGQGNVIKRYSPTDTPEKIGEDLEKLIYGEQIKSIKLKPKKIGA